MTIFCACALNWDAFQSYLLLAIKPTVQSHVFSLNCLKDINSDGSANSF